MENKSCKNTLTVMIQFNKNNKDDKQINTVGIKTSISIHLIDEYLGELFKLYQQKKKNINNNKYCKIYF